MQETLTSAKAIANSIADKKGRDIVMIDIREKSSFADYFVNATATNIRMLDTLQNEIEKTGKENGVELRHAEGKAASGWILLDFGDIIVNLFLEEQRSTYNIEKIWSDGAFIEFLSE
ncbi:MAG: ribosome silencing factor [Clostridiales Family XIII bacterium]|jgi:ribosome-associated protein|nr:ribosome silencing factor [Clostridiales Family XIII bacterium]